MSSIYSIYKVTNTINNKVYIGFDSNWPTRKKEHFRESSTSTRIFHKAIRKYGWQNFEWEIIYQSKDRDYTLNVMEKYFIKEYNSFGENGYNMTVGGEGTFGFKISDDTRKLLSEKRAGKNNPNYGKTGKLSPIFGKKLHTNDFKLKVKKMMCEKNPSKLFRVVCEHCQLEVSKSNHTRWHGKKCKLFLVAIVHPDE